MENDASNDVEAVVCVDIQDETDTEKRPIMLLLKRLIRNKQNTVMTNSQILEILKLEFDMNITDCHELEIDIYIKIIKKYLKDWPQWEELERISSKLSSAKDYEAVTKVLNNKYKNLKEYLGAMLNAAREYAKKAVEDLPDSNKDEDTDDVVMEVYCTRNQLNHLVIRKPRTDLNNTIFNIDKIEPTKISVGTPSFETILNFLWTKIIIVLPNFVLHRELSYKFNHKLVNRVRDEKTPVEVLDTRFHFKCKKMKEMPKKLIYTYFDKILKDLSNCGALHPILESVFRVIKGDLKYGPEKIGIGTQYRQFANKYKYMRNLCIENTENNDPTYDLQIEELMAPCYQFCLIKMMNNLDTDNFRPGWLRIECLLCKVKFIGPADLVNQVENHYNEYHQHEPEWKCSNCEVTFNMDYLSAKRWRHICQN